MKKIDAPLFTIVILTYNRKNVLVQLLRELSNIERQDVEIIVVDNGSQDGTFDMLQHVFPEVLPVKLKDNFGAVARNKGIGLARGKYTVTIDDDILGLDGVALDHLRNLFEIC